MQKRNPLAVVGLSIITFGIYDIYWLYVTKKELNEKTSIHTPTIWLLISGPIVLIVGYILLFAGGAASSTTTTYGSSTKSSVSAIFFVGLGLLLVGWLFTLVATIIWTYKYSKAVNEYTKGKMSTAVSFLILYLIHLIGVALIQDTFNDILDNPGAYVANGAPPQPPAPPVSPAPQPMPTQPTNPESQQPVTVQPPTEPPANTPVQPAS